MPTSARTMRTCFASSVSSIPSTCTSPESCFSSRFTQRISVDFPEPDGPHRTIFSPRRTCSEIELSTLNALKLFESPLIDIASSLFGTVFIAEILCISCDSAIKPRGCLGVECASRRAVLPGYNLTVGQPLTPIDNPWVVNGTDSLVDSEPRGVLDCKRRV